MKFDLGNLTKKSIRSSRMSLERRCFMLQSLICKLLLCGFHQLVSKSHVIHKYILHTINNIRFRNKVLIAGVAAGGWAYRKHRQKTNVHIMALNLVRGVPLTPKEKQTMLELLTPPPSQATSSFWWSRFQRK